MLIQQWPITVLPAAPPRGTETPFISFKASCCWYPALIILQHFLHALALLAGTDTGGIQNRLGVLFFALLYLSLMTLSSLPVWREERLLYVRERDSGAYGTGAYYIAVCGATLLLHSSHVTSRSSWQHHSSGRE
jgi:hypothetical protein